MWGNSRGVEHKPCPLELAAALRSRAALVGLAMATVLTAGTAQAQDFWTGAISSDWFDGGNWTDGSVPTAADIVFVHPSIPGITSIGLSPGGASAAELYVSNEDGNGYVSIAGGGVLTTDLVVLGPSGSAVMRVTGVGSTLNSTEFTIGGAGSGLLQIVPGGQVNSGDTIMGDSATGSGTATLENPGVLWAIGGAFTIGNRGIGRLEIINGSAVVSGRSALGAEAGSFGEVTVTGGGSIWNSTITIIGFNGDAALTIEDGGTVNSTAVNVAGQGSTALITVRGGGSSWNVTNELDIGILGAGTLIIDNGGSVNSSQGGIAMTEEGTGSVFVWGAGSNWTNAATLQIGVNGAGTLSIASGGAVSNANGYIGRGPRSTGTVSVIGGGSTWTNTGDLYVGDDGEGTLYIGLGATASVAGTVSVANNPGSSGLLIVNGGFTGSGGISVNAGGRLAGSGTVTGNTSVAGVVAPGNSIGTLGIAGTYTQAPGSTYEVEVDAAGGSDLIAVTGAAVLNGGTVEVIPFPDFALGTPYIILTATGGVTGMFDAATMGASAFLSPQLVHGSNDVVLTIVQNASFASAALTPNQRAAAAGADSQGAGNPVWEAILLLPSVAAPTAFDAISGEVHASATSVLIEDSRFVREAMDDRLRAAFAGVAASATPVLSYAEGGPVAAPAHGLGPAAWGHVFGAWSEWDSDGNAAALNRDAGGFFLGGDMVVGENWRLGLLAGYGHSGFAIDDRASSGSADSYHLGVYAGTEIDQWGLRLGGAYSWHDIETDRTATMPGFSDALSARYGAATAQFFGEAGYRIDTDTASFEPFANLAYVNVSTDGFTESGGAAALTGSSSTENMAFTTLGLRAETTLQLGGTVVRAHGTLGWRHAFGDVTPTTDLAFAGGDAFTIAGVPIAQDAAVIEAGLDLALSPSASFGVAYNGQIGSGVQEHQVQAHFGVTF